MLMLLGPILMINVLLDIGDCFHIRELRHNLCAFVLLQTWVIGMSFEDISNWKLNPFRTLDGL